jgi:hypothetical protein
MASPAKRDLFAGLYLKRGHLLLFLGELFLGSVGENFEGIFLNAGNFSWGLTDANLYLSGSV